MDIEERLQNALTQEIKILREILENINSEQKALFNRDLELLNRIIEERLDLLEVFEKFNEKLLECTFEMLELHDKSIPSRAELAYLAVLEILRSIVPIDNIELRYSLDQLKIITDEIEKLNSITMSYLESRPLQSLECTAKYVNPLHIIDGQYREKPKKIALKLLEPDDEQDEG